MYLIWSMLNGLSVIMSLSLISLQVPGIANMIQQIILQIVFLDILQTSDWLVPFFERVNIDSDGNSVGDDSLNLYFANSGLSSMYMFINMGSTFIFIIAFIALLITHLILLKLAPFSTW
jgi:hypothetical protein